jgi:hypothetical protein
MGCCATAVDAAFGANVLNRQEPLMRTAARNSPWVCGFIICRQAEIDPADWPCKVMEALSPPKYYKGRKEITLE